MTRYNVSNKPDGKIHSWIFAQPPKGKVEPGSLEKRSEVDSILLEKQIEKKIMDVWEDL